MSSPYPAGPLSSFLRWGCLVRTSTTSVGGGSHLKPWVSSIEFSAKLKFWDAIGFLYLKAFWIKVALSPAGCQVASWCPIAFMAMDCLGLYQEWERDSEVRDRMRTTKKLQVHQIDEEFCSPCRVNAVENSVVLKPVLSRLSRHPKWKLPYLEDLKFEVENIYERCGLDATEKQVYSACVDIKRLTGLVKRRCKRHEVTRVGCYSKKM